MIPLTTTGALILSVLSLGAKIAVVIWIILKLYRIAHNIGTLENKLEDIQKNLKEIGAKTGDH